MSSQVPTITSEELIGDAILSEIRSLIADGYNRIELLNAHVADIVEGDGGHLFAVVFAAKEDV